MLKIPFSEEKKIYVLRRYFILKCDHFEPQLQEMFNFWKPVLIKMHWSFTAMTNNPNSWSVSQQYWQNKQ